MGVSMLGTTAEAPAPKRLRRTLLDGALRDGVPEPEVFEAGVLLAGKVHQIYAGPGEGKSWLALFLAAKGVERGQTVFYLDAENGHRITTERLQALGVRGADANLHYYDFPDLDMSHAAT